MAQKIIASYEILAQPIVPDPGNYPYVQQGAFLQISNLDAVARVIDIDPDFPDEWRFPCTGLPNLA